VSTISPVCSVSHLPGLYPCFGTTKDRALLLVSPGESFSANCLAAAVCQLLQQLCRCTQHLSGVRFLKEDDDALFV
jgi:hypothetical protein